jgi:L-amino acid N-acyltransferase YncA
MTDLSALWRDDATDEEITEVYQHLVDTGDAWRLEGSVGRTAMDLIEAGAIVLGEVGHRDFYGNYVPSRHEVEPGTKGSVEYAQRVNGEDE